jgi:serine protease
VSAAAVDGNGIGTYNVTIDRTGLADNDYSGTITFTLSNATTVTVDVAMQVRSTGDQIGDTGYMYILLVDPDTLNTIGQVDLGATGGVYDYTFASVAAGSYYVIGGSDVDNDGFICDIGETCGSYPVLNEQFVLDVTGSRTDIDFTSSVISGVTTNRASAIAGRPVEGFKLLPDTDRTHKAVSRR